MSDNIFEDAFNAAEAEPKPKAIRPEDIKNMVFGLLGSDLDDTTEEIAGFESDVFVDGVRTNPNPDIHVPLGSVMGAMLGTVEAAVAEEDNETVPEEEPKTPEKEEPTVPVAEEPRRFEFTDLEIKDAVHGLIKKNTFSKTYVFGDYLVVTLSPPDDLANSALNIFFGFCNRKGDKRVKVAHIDPYLDNKTKQNIPGGRTEEVYYVNPDMSRAMSRATMAIYVKKIGDDLLPEIDKKYPLESLEKRIEKLEEYSPFLLDQVNDKALLPFMALLEEASKKLANF